MNHNRFGLSAEKLEISGQLSFAEVEDQMYLFNEVKVLATYDTDEFEEIIEKKRPTKKKEQKI